MTFKYNKAGWYKMRNGEKAWVEGDLSERGFCGEVCLMGFIANNRMTNIGWQKDGTYLKWEHGEQEFDLIEKYVEPRTFWVAIIINKKNVNLELFETTGVFDSKNKLDSHIFNIKDNWNVIAIHKITEGEGV